MVDPYGYRSRGVSAVAARGATAAYSYHRHSGDRHLGSLVRACIVGVAIFVGTPSGAAAQDSASAFLTGDCPRRGPAPDLSTVSGAPDTAPILRGKHPKTPRFALQDFYRGRVVVAFVVDTRGRVERATAVVLESTDPRLSAWACENVPLLRFQPAVLSGKPVRAQTALPFQFTAFVQGPR